MEERPGKQREIWNLKNKISKNERNIYQILSTSTFFLKEASQSKKKVENTIKIFTKNVHFEPNCMQGDLPKNCFLMSQAVGNLGRQNSQRREEKRTEAESGRPKPI